MGLPYVVALCREVMTMNPNSISSLGCNYLVCLHALEEVKCNKIIPISLFKLRFAKLRFVESKDRNYVWCVEESLVRFESKLITYGSVFETYREKYKR